MNEVHMCNIFHCDRLLDRYCRFYCERKYRCKRPCQNHPDKCGQAFVKKTKIKEDKNYGRH